MQIDTDLRKRLEESDFHKQLLAGDLHLDNSRFENWDHCLQKGICANALKRIPSHKRVALDFGSIWHAAMEQRRAGKPLSSQDSAGVTLARELAYAPPPDDRRSIERYKQMLADYHTSWATSLDKEPQALVIDGSPLVEQTFAVPIGHFAIPTIGRVHLTWTGKIDTICRFKDKVWIEDHKTTSVMGEQFAFTYQRSSQIMGYMNAGYALAHALDFEPPFGVLLDAICTRSSKNEAGIFEIPVPSWKVDEWRVEILHRVQQVCEAYIKSLDSGVVPLTRTSCVTKFGKCPYFQVCELHPTMRLRSLDSEDYQDDTWDPLKKKNVP